MVDGRRALWRRWAGIVAVALLVASGCVTAGVWQWHRHEQRSQAAALVDANHDADPVRLEEVLAPDGTLADDDVWRPVRVVGRYVGGTVLLRNRPVSGTPAYHVLGGLEVTEGPFTGSVLVVDRGWVPAGEGGDRPGDVPAPPSGEVALVARLRTAEEPSDRAAPTGQVQALAPEQVRAAGGWDAPTLGTTAVLATEGGERPAGLRALPRPDTSLGSHLSYTFQWWVFALGALGGAVVLVRRDLRDDALDAAGHEPDSPHGTHVHPPRTSDAPSRRRRRVSAEEEEDAILDAQVAALDRQGADT